jgi:hypothetical protein
MAKTYQIPVLYMVYSELGVRRMHDGVSTTAAQYTDASHHYRNPVSRLCSASRQEKRDRRLLHQRQQQQQPRA